MFKSLLHWKVWVNILITLCIFGVLVWATFRWLDIHTNYGKEVPVPNVVNMSVKQAVEELENMGLTVEVDSFKYDPKYKPFQVLQIYPSAGSRVKEGRTIMLRVNPKTWAKVEVPDLIDKYKGLAFSRLELLGLKMGDTLYEPSIQKDAVLKMFHKGMELKPGTLLPKFATVDLLIGSGPLRDITIPNVVGLTVKEAREVIKSSKFEVGLIDYQDSNKDIHDIVYYQDPATGSLRDQGMQIDIWASKKTPAEMTEKIKELDKIYRIELEDPKGEGDAIPTTPPPAKKKVEKPKEEASKPKETVPATAPKEKKDEEKPKKKVVVE